MAMIIVGSRFYYYYSYHSKYTNSRCSDDAPLATSSENVYVVWWSNETGENEVISERI
jgi:hypothetical protein